MIFSSPDFDGHEQVVAFCDAAAGLKGFIAIHSTALGPAFGGCRMWAYEHEAAAVADALRLSRGMSYKNAIAGLAYGGGKAVIMGDPYAAERRGLFRAFGRAVDRLAGRYITAEDVGVGVEDMRAAAEETEWVAGIPRECGYRGGDPSPVTARGVMAGLAAAVRHGLGRDSTAMTVRAVRRAMVDTSFKCAFLRPADKSTQPRVRVSCGVMLVFVTPVSLLESRGESHAAGRDGIDSRHNRRHGHRDRGLDHRLRVVGHSADQGA